MGRTAANFYKAGIYHSVMLIKKIEYLYQIKGTRQIQLDDRKALTRITDSIYDATLFKVLSDNVEQHVWEILGRDMTPFILATMK